MPQSPYLNWFGVSADLSMTLQSSFWAIPSLRARGVSTEPGSSTSSSIRPASCIARTFANSYGATYFTAIPVFFVNGSKYAFWQASFQAPPQPIVAIDGASASTRCTLPVSTPRSGAVAAA